MQKSLESVDSVHVAESMKYSNNVEYISRYNGKQRKTGKYTQRLQKWSGTTKPIPLYSMAEGKLLKRLWYAMKVKGFYNGC